MVVEGKKCFYIAGFLFAYDLILVRRIFPEQEELLKITSQFSMSFRRMSASVSVEVLNGAIFVQS